MDANTFFFLKDMFMFDVPVTYCGPAGFTLAQLKSICRAVNASKWFAGDQVFLLHKARVGIRHACNVLGIGSGDEVLVPAYNCGTEIDALASSGASVGMFRIDRNCQIDMEDLVGRINEKTKAVYVTHYFGFPQSLEELKKVCQDKQICLIEDCALALFSFWGTDRLGAKGDIAVYNFPKTLPVPDGGAMVVNNPDYFVEDWQLGLPPIPRIFRDSLPLLKRYVLRKAEGHGTLFSVVCKMFDKKKAKAPVNNTHKPDMPENYYYDENLNDEGISPVTKRMLSFFDENSVRQRRRSNFKRYLSLLLGVTGVKCLYDSLPVGVCPLHFPVIVDNRREISSRLKALAIDSTEWWAGYHRRLPWPDHPDACYLKDNILVLPVLQQLEDHHIEYISEKLISISREVSR